VFLAALARPLGGVLIGYIGDKKGRSVALFWSMMIMAFSSFAMAFLPSYAQIGVWATVGLLVLRMFQTMSAASELNGSAIFLIETLDVNPQKRSKKGLSSGLAWCFTVLGMLGGSYASYKSTIDNWKTPFLLGGLIGLFAIFLRLIPKAHKESEPKSAKKVQFNFMRSVVSSILIAMGVSGMFYYNMIWMIGHLQCQLDPTHVRFYSILYFSVYALMLFIGGAITDYIKKTYKPMMFATLMLSLLALPTIIMKDLNFNIINVGLLAVFVGPSHAVLFDLFPKEYRYRGVSITYSIGTSLVGGVTPFICNYFSKQYQYFPAFWLMFVAFLGFLGVFISRKVLIKE
jgi:MHS family proline/betaine transporter-like MFS transporter